MLWVLIRSTQHNVLFVFFFFFVLFFFFFEGEKYFPGTPSCLELWVMSYNRGS